MVVVRTGIKEILVSNGVRIKQQGAKTIDQICSMPTSTVGILVLAVNNNLRSPPTQEKNFYTKDQEGNAFLPSV